MTGKVYLVGAGCGDPELITQKALHCLSQCDVVLYDHLVSPKLFDHLPLHCERISVGKRYGAHSVPQTETNHLLVKLAKEGKTVVRLKGGDPFVFGRGGEEILALQEANIPFAVVPGITSAIAVAEIAGIPVTHRQLSRSFHVITGHTADGETTLTEDYDTLAKLDGTLVFLMGVHNLHEITKRLIAGGKDPQTPAAIISQGTTAKERTLRTTLGRLAEECIQENMTSPAVIVIGTVAALDFSATIPLPLKGIKIGATGTKTITQKQYERFSDLGAEVVEMDFSRICPYENNPALEKSLDEIAQYKWIIFTSISGVTCFFTYLKNHALDIRRLGRLRFAVIGKGTAEALAERGILADFMPPVFDVEALAEGLCGVAKNEEQLLILRAEQGSAVLTEILEANQFSFTDVKLYDVKTDEEKRQTAWEQVKDMDFITFASGSGVRGFFASGKSALPESCKAVCIGQSTARELQEHGISEKIIAEEYTTDGLVEAILREVTKQ